MLKAPILACVALAAVAVSAATAQPIDLHAYWDDRCSECHGHSAAFARQRLTIENGQLIGRWREVTFVAFLENHHGHAELAPRLLAMLTAQATTEPLYAEKCAKCHQSAASLARASLAVQDGRLVVKGSGMSVADLLKRHGKLSPAEAASMVETLKRVLGEVGGG